MAVRKHTDNFWEIKVLRVLLGLYIVLCLLIAGLNFGVAPGASEETADLIRKIWHLYENQFKTFLIIIGSILTWRVLGNKGKMQKRNFLFFFCAALINHILGPFISGNPDLYFFSMPLPWSTTGLQSLVEESGFYASHLPLWGLAGISASLIFYLLITVVVYVGTLVWGRRWQCSSLCLFNGFISETFSPAYSIKEKSPFWRNRLFPFLKWLLLIASIFFASFWIYTVVTDQYNHSLAEILSQIEVYKYLSLELLMAMFLWIAFTGRGYCHFCPLGTVLSWISRVTGQRIKTDKTSCISCKKCDLICPMGISISLKAQKKENVTDLQCVGCGHCIDICPVETLEYRTYFLDKFKRS